MELLTSVNAFTALMIDSSKLSVLLRQWGGQYLRQGGSEHSVVVQLPLRMVDIDGAGVVDVRHH